MICIGLSAVLFKERLSTAQIFGVCISMFGIAIYSMKKMPLLSCVHQRKKFSKMRVCMTQFLTKIHWFITSSAARYGAIAIFVIILLTNFKPNESQSNILKPRAHAASIFTRRCINANDIEDSLLLKKLPPMSTEQENSVFILLENSKACLKGGQFAEGHTFFLAKAAQRNTRNV